MVLRGWALVFFVVVLAGCTHLETVEQAHPNPFQAGSSFRLEPLDDPSLDAAVRHGLADRSGVRVCPSCEDEIRVQVVRFRLGPDEGALASSELRARVTIASPNGQYDVVEFERHLPPKYNWMPRKDLADMLGEELGKSVGYYLYRRVPDA